MFSMELRMSDLSHGGDLSGFADLYPKAPRPLIDLSTGINRISYPFEPSLQAAARLPGRLEHQACLAAFAQYAGVNKKYIQIMSGSQSAISILPTLVEPCDVAILEPTYSEHEINWRRFGHRVSTYNATDILTCDANIIVLTNPNNPDGRVFEHDALMALQEQQGRKSGWLIVDEAFVDPVPEASLSGSVSRGGLIVLRSFGKFFGLAGLRLGFLIAPEVVNTRIEERLGPWNVNGPALQIGATAYEDEEWIGATRRRLRDDSQRLVKMLEAANLSLKGGTPLFQLIQSHRARALSDHLASRGIYVRTFAYDDALLRFGLPGHSSEWDRLRNALEETEEMS
jgi:cobalamin biosynthesis protein CobC